MSPRFAITLNALALYAIAAVLLAAFYFQFTLQELPCPLCLLQRVTFSALALGPILTLRHGPRASFYALTIIAALAGAGIAARQILLHVSPGDPGYGSAFLGYHFYTWAFGCFAVAIVASAVALLFEEQFEEGSAAPQFGLFEQAGVWLVIALTLLNAASAFAECGFALCPASPVQYELLNSWG